MIPGIVAGAWRERDPYWSYCVLGMHMDGADNGTTFTDARGKTVTRFNAVTKTGIKKFGTASAYFDGTGDYLSVASSADFTLGTGDLTIEFFVRFPVTPTGKEIVNSGSAGGFAVYVYSTGVAITTAGGGADVSRATTWALDTWYHVAITRSAGTAYVFVDGTLNSSSGALATNFTQTGLYVGRYGTNDFNGYIDELRIYKGVAKWTSNFTPPTKEYPDL